MKRKNVRGNIEVPTRTNSEAKEYQSSGIDTVVFENIKMDATAVTDRPTDVPVGVSVVDRTVAGDMTTAAGVRVMAEAVGIIEDDAATNIEMGAITVAGRLTDVGVDVSVVDRTVEGNITTVAGVRVMAEAASTVEDDASGITTEAKVATPRCPMTTNNALS